MQLKLQHDDPHDAIAAQLRDLAPRLVPNSSETVPVTQQAPAAQNAPATQEAPVAAPASTAEPPLRATPLNDNAGDIRNSALRVRSSYRVARMLFFLCAVGAVVFAWHSYGEEAKQKFSEFAPQLLATVLGPAQSTNTAETQSTSPPAAATQTAASVAAAPPTTATQPAAERAPAQGADATTPATPAQSFTADATPPAAAEPPPAQATIPPELASSIESMAREIETLKQTVEELKAGQQQLGREIAKATEHTAPRNVTPQASKPSRPQRRQHVSTTVTAPHPRTPYLPPQTYSQGQSYPPPVQREAAVPPPPAAPAQLPPQTDDDGVRVPRPPMPVR